MNSIKIYTVATLLDSVKPCFLHSLRLYARWNHRTPAKAYLPFEDLPKSNLRKEEIIDLDAIKESKLKIKKPVLAHTNILKNVTKENFQPKAYSKRKETKSKEPESVDNQEVFDENNVVIYEKLGDNDGRISNIIISAKSKKQRSKSDQILVEGWRLIIDGLEAKSTLKYLIFSRLEDLNKIRPFLPTKGVKVFKIPYKEIEMWSDLETPPGVIGIFKTPSPENIKMLYEPLPLQIICDNVRTPGNLGAILRAAVGVGCKKILLTKGCVDLWEPKVIRSASGAHFRLPIYKSLDWSEIDSMVDDNNTVLIADNKTSLTSSDDVEACYAKELPLVPYYGVDYASLNYLTLIIGGETEGISEDSYRFATERNGLRLNIPLEKGVDSLNTGMATAVITFEIKKQIQQAEHNLKLARKSSNNC